MTIIGALPGAKRERSPQLSNGRTDKYRVANKLREPQHTDRAELTSIAFGKLRSSILRLWNVGSYSGIIQCIFTHELRNFVELRIGAREATGRLLAEIWR